MTSNFSFILLKTNCIRRYTSYMSSNWFKSLTQICKRKDYTFFECGVKSPRVQKVISVTVFVVCEKRFSVKFLHTYVYMCLCLKCQVPGFQSLRVRIFIFHCKIWQQAQSTETLISPIWDYVLNDLEILYFTKWFYSVL